jgi:glutathione S-transferase
MLKLYDSRLSGNAYKVRLLLHTLGIPFQRVTLDLAKGAARTPEMLARNPLGRIPILELEDGHTLFESNAILFYLAEGTKYLPDDRLQRAEVLQWLMFEQFDLVRALARARFLISISRQKEKYRAHIAELQEMGRKALEHLEHRLENSPYVAGNQYTIADMAIYAYTHIAEEGEYDMAIYPAIRGWLARVEQQPGYVRLL